MPEGERLNVVVIMTDQQRADMRAAEGFALDTMPTLDELGRGGADFRHGYTSIPICAPARASLFTGRYASAHGIRGNYRTDGIRYEGDWLDVLRELGHRLILTGKNHSYREERDFDACRHYSHTLGPHRPGREQEDAAFGEQLGAYRHMTAVEPTPFPVDCQYPVRIVDDAIEQLGAGCGEPFFLWLSFPEPHNPYQVPRPYFDLFPPDELPERVAGPEALEGKNDQWQFQFELLQHYHPDSEELWRRYRSNYLGMLRLIDDQLARFLEHLERTGLRERTLIIFTADHGDFVGEYGLWRKGVALPECLIRVPFIISGPGVRPAGAASPAHVSLVDLLPTVCDAVGAATPIGAQGRSLWPMLTGAEPPGEELRTAYAEHGLGTRAARREEVPFDEETCWVEREGRPGSFHELNNYVSSGFRRAVISYPCKLICDDDFGDELYDLARDPVETRNLAGSLEYAETQARLTRELLGWSMRVQDTLPLRDERDRAWRHSAWRVYTGRR